MAQTTPTTTTKTPQPQEAITEAVKDAEIINITDTNPVAQQMFIYSKLIYAIQLGNRRLMAHIRENMGNYQHDPFSDEKVLHFKFPKSRGKQPCSQCYKLVFSLDNGLVVYRLTPEATWQVTSLHEIGQVPAPTTSFSTPLIDPAPTPGNAVPSVVELYPDRPAETVATIPTPDPSAVSEPQPAEPTTVAPLPVAPRKRSAKPKKSTKGVLADKRMPEVLLSAPLHRKVTVGRKSCDTRREGNDVLPGLNFGGQYLKQFGFLVGKELTMVLEPNKITLTVDRPGADAEYDERIKRIKKNRQIMRDISAKLFDDISAEEESVPYQSSKRKRT